MPVVAFNHFNLRAPTALTDALKDFYVDVVGLSVGWRPPFDFPGYWLYLGEQAVLHLVGVPGALGMLLVLLSGQRWVTALGAFIVSIAPGWFGVLVAIQFPLLDIIYFVEPHVYAIGLAISVTAIYLLTLACAWYPSRMATRVEPAEALRYE